MRKQLLVRVGSSEINRNHVRICHGFDTPGRLGEPRKPAGLEAWKPWDPQPRSVRISSEPLQPPLWHVAWPGGKFWLELRLQDDCYRDECQNKAKARASKASLLFAQVGSNPSSPLPAPGPRIAYAVGTVNVSLKCQKGQLLSCHHSYGFNPTKQNKNSSCPS